MVLVEEEENKINVVLVEEEENKRNVVVVEEENNKDVRRSMWWRETCMPLKK